MEKNYGKNTEKYGCIEIDDKLVKNNNKKI